MAEYLSAADLRRSLRQAAEAFTAHVGPAAVERQTFTLRIPPRVASACDVLAVDVDAVITSAAVELGWRRWRVEYAR